MVNLNCKCTKCQNGDTNIGVLFMNKKSNEQNFNQLNKIEEKNSDDKISIFDIIDDEEEKKNSENNNYKNLFFSLMLLVGNIK